MTFGPLISHWSHPWWTALVLALVFTACAVGDEREVEQADRPESERIVNGRVAYVSITSRNALGRAQVPVTVAAQFTQFEGVEVRTVRRSLDLWTPDSDLLDGECVLRDSAMPIAPADWYDTRIELLHAGVLELSTVDSEMLLEPRRMPELLPYLGGYTYGTDDEQRLQYSPELGVDLWSAGGDDVGQFGVTLSMPEPIVLAYIGGRAVGSATSLDVDLDDALVVLWEPVIGDEPVYVVLEEDGIQHGPILTCLAADDGAFAFSREALASLTADGSATALRLTIRRAHHATIDLSGFDRADAVAITEHGVVLY